MVFISKGASSARLYLTALPDAIAESNETITLGLIADQSPNTTPSYAVGNSYALGSVINATVNISDSGHYRSGIAILDHNGNAVTETNPLEANSQGEVNFRLKLTSQPTQNVTVSIDTVTFTFTPTNWDTPQNVTLTGITSTRILSVSSTSQDTSYKIGSSLTIKPNDGIPNLGVTEGQNPLPTTIPSVSIVWVSDTNEGSQLPGVFQLLLSQPAPNEGLTINYQVTGTATVNNDYAELSGIVNIEAGQTSVFLNIPVINDWTKENAETVVVSLQAGQGYTVNSATSNATLTINDDDRSGIAFASPQTTASVTTNNDLFNVSVISFENHSGSFAVALNQQPTDNVIVRFSDALNNQAIAEVLTFTPQNWQSFQ
ncbi:MAG: Calx-beta domain-containing protein, partial [Microcystaceae cyanobacterium]